MLILQRVSAAFPHRIIDLGGLFTALAAVSVATASVRGWAAFAAEGFTPRLSDMTLLLFLYVAWSICLAALWLARAEQHLSLSAELQDVLKTVAYCTGLLALCALLTKWHTLNREMLLAFAGTAAMLLFVVRLAKRRLFPYWRRNGGVLRRALVVGTGPRAQQMAEMVATRPELGYELVGFVDDRPGPGVIGPLAEIDAIIAANVVDELMIALPVRSYYNAIERILEAAEEQGITAHLHSDLFSRRAARIANAQLESLPVVSHYTGPQFSVMLVSKRAFDLAGAAALLALLAPALLLIALLVRLTSRGPALFAQTRVGYNKRRFKMYKFRTMVADAEQRQAEIEALNEAPGPVFKIRRDPRITLIGHFLRKTSLDELPQLFNVLLGDLSLVGPRPLPLRDVKRFDAHRLNRRFSIKPGITCIWQVSGRSRTSFDKWVEQDLEYIDNWSFLLDVKILLRTVPAVLRGDGAM